MDESNEVLTHPCSNPSPSNTQPPPTSPPPLPPSHFGVRLSPASLQLHAQPQVRDFELPSSPHQHIGWLHVPVHHPAGVEVAHALRHLRDVGELSLSPTSIFRYSYILTDTHTYSLCCCCSRVCVSLTCRKLAQTATSSISRPALARLRTWDFRSPPGAHSRTRMRKPPSTKAWEKRGRGFVMVEWPQNIAATSDGLTGPLSCSPRPSG